MEKNYSTMLMAKKQTMPLGQMLVESNISTDYEISKILSIDTRVSLPLDTYSSIKEGQVIGKLVLNIIYIDAEGNINSENHTSPISYKLENDNLDKVQNIITKAYVSDNDIFAKSGKDLKITTTISFENTLITNGEQQYLSDCGSNTFTKLSEVEGLSYSKNTCERFEEELEVAIKGGVKKILNTTTQLDIKNISAGTNFVAVEGELVANILFVGNEEPNELQSIVINKEFKQEFDSEGITSQTLFDFMPYVIYDEVTTNIDGDDDNQSINIKVPILMCFDFYEKTSYMSIVDMYSTKDLIDITKENIAGSRFFTPFVIEGKIEGSVIISEDNPRVDKYLCTTNINATPTNVYVKDGTLYIDGITTANVLYLNDETDGILSVEIEIPFVVSGECELSNDANIITHICLENTDVMVKRGKEIFLDAKLKALITASEDYNFETITNVDVVGELAPKDTSLEIYFGKNGESVWDIAKNLKIPSELILAQNPDLSDPLEKDAKIAIYYQKTRE